MIKWDKIKADEESFARFNDTVIAQLPEGVHEKAAKLAAYLCDDEAALFDFGEILTALNGMGEKKEKEKAQKAFGKK